MKIVVFLSFYFRYFVVVYVVAIKLKEEKIEFILEDEILVVFLSYFSDFISNNKDIVIILFVNRIKCKD